MRPSLRTVVVMETNTRNFLIFQRHAHDGFTLIEILVVLVIVGMMTSIALPRLTSLYSSVENSSQRNALRGQIEALGYMAYSSGRAIVLESTIIGGDSPKASPLQLPEGWRIELAKPVRYASSGICTGGKLLIRDPQGGVETFELTPPLCRLNGPGVDGA